MAPCEGIVPEGNREAFDCTSNTPKGRFKDIKVYPKSSSAWVEKKRADDDVGPYWRIHDKLYDLTGFMEKHPGGKFWLEITKGTDVTEAFESFHIDEKAEQILPKYFVKDIDKPRNSPYTFQEDGFYRTLKKKVRPILKKIGKGPSLTMIIMQDSLMLAFVTLAIAGSIWYSYPTIVLSGLFLAMTIMCAHNFFHQRDNFRMYYFDLGLLTSHDWRVSHGLSHHLFTNTRYDLEITALEPLLVFMPKKEKTFVQRYVAQAYELLFLPVGFFIQCLERMYYIWSKQTPFRMENLLPLVELVIMCALAPTFTAGIKMWFALHAVCATWFSGIGITVAHHHPEVYHEGDRFRENPDWGLCQLDAVRDRFEIKGNLFFVATTFGDHSLHHLLPTVDHSKLDALYPAFFETCQEFNIPYEFLSYWEMSRGMYRQLANNEPNPNPPGYKDKQSNVNSKKRD